MKEIKLSQTGKLAGKYVVLVDDEDYEYLNQWMWSVNKNRTEIYASRYQNINGKRICHYMHRVIMNTPSNMQVDHVNHNTLDNQKHNLRVCTSYQNQTNKTKRKNTEQFIGVNYRKDTGKYRAHIAPHRKQISIGCFDSAEAAAIARDKVAIVVFGEFANLNFPNLRHTETV